MSHLKSRLRLLTLPASTENTIPSFTTPQTRVVSFLDLTVRWSAVSTPVLLAITALCGPVIPEKLWWGVIAGTFAERSLVRFQRVRRR
ncbi:hypothetical protein [Streptomyces sp. NPDC046985]|uniref:hypothetical protein n=1 Tax=Streptomyces sp. NPDC046985 TaxID=3155377 RepID=UPI00340C8386